jgi:hypothetical protein
MTSATSQPHRPAGDTSSTAWRYRILAVMLVIAGGVLLAGNLDIWPANWHRFGQLAGPLMLVVLGAGLMAVARGATAMASFAIERMDYDSAMLVADSSAADLELGSFAGSSQLFVGQFPSLAGPGIRVRGGEARLELTGRYTLPLSGARNWTAHLAKGLSWRLDLRSWTGDLRVDLRDIALTDARLRSSFGNMAVTLPATGQATLDVRLLAGDVKLVVPAGLAVKLKVRAGPLTTVRADERRYVQLSPGEWASPLFAVSADRCSLNVSMWAGDLELE